MTTLISILAVFSASLALVRETPSGQGIAFALANTRAGVGDATAEAIWARVSAAEMRTAHVNRGAALPELKRWAEALAAVDRALAIEPTNENASIGRTRALDLRPTGGTSSQVTASSPGAYTGTWTSSGLRQRLIGSVRLELTFGAGRSFELKRYEEERGRATLTLVATVTIPYTVAADGTLVVGSAADPYYTVTRSGDTLQVAFAGRAGPARPTTRSVALVWDLVGPTTIELIPKTDDLKTSTAPRLNSSVTQLEAATALCLRLLDEPTNDEVTSQLIALGQAAVAPMMAQLQAQVKYWSTPDYAERYAATKAFSAPQRTDRATGNEIYLLQVPPMSSDEVAVLFMSLRLADLGVQEALPLIRQVLAYNEPIRVRGRQTMDLAIARLAARRPPVR